ncbi:MAG TPA: VOC family protein [Chromatiaceae bacterium]|nr:VOC family protein [Chromatiaceae bacterium]
MNRPEMSYGLRHVALYVRDLPACERFYVELLGMNVEWRPDERNVYLSSGSDNLALHQGAADIPDEAIQRLDHIGFFLATESLVDEWFVWLKDHNVPIRTEPRTHRDGARSFYCYDPDGTQVQIIYHPPVCAWEASRA